MPAEAGVAERFAPTIAHLRDQVVMRDQLPIITDASSCTQSLAEMVRHWRVPVLDVIEFAADELLPRLTVTRPLDSVMVHPTCASTRLGINEDLMEVAQFISDDVSVPLSDDTHT